MRKIGSFRPPFAALLALLVAALTGLAAAVFAAVVFWSAYESTLRQLREQGEVTVVLMARLAEPGAAPEVLSRQLDGAALLVGGVGFAVDDEGRFRAHPHIASGLFAAGVDAARHDAVIAGLDDPNTVAAGLSAGEVEGYLVHLRGDDYGVFLKRLARPAG